MSATTWMFSVAPSLTIDPVKVHRDEGVHHPLRSALSAFIEKLLAKRAELERRFGPFVRPEPEPKPTRAKVDHRTGRRSRIGTSASEPRQGWSDCMNEAIEKLANDFGGLPATERSIALAIFKTVHEAILQAVVQPVAPAKSKRWSAPKDRRIAQRRKPLRHRSH